MTLKSTLAICGLILAGCALLGVLFLDISARNDAQGAEAQSAIDQILKGFDLSFLFPPFLTILIRRRPLFRASINHRTPRRNAILAKYLILKEASMHTGILTPGREMICKMFAEVVKELSSRCMICDSHIREDDVECFWCAADESSGIPF